MLREGGPGSVEIEFSTYFRATAPSVRRYVARLVDSHSVDDVVSETFTVAWRRWDEISDVEHRRAWTFRVAHHRVLRWYEAEGRHRHDELDGRDRQGHGDHADGVAAADRTTRLLATLPPAERAAMALIVLDDMSPSDAAFVLGCSTTALTTRLHRARQRLAAALQETTRMEALR